MRGPGPGPDPYLALSDAASQEHAVEERRRLREQLDRAADVATWVGTLRDLAESRSPVTLSVVGGRTRRGAVTAVGSDVLVVATPAGDRLLIRLDQVRAVYIESSASSASPGAGPAPARGHRGPASPRRFLTVLSSAVEHDPLVSLWLEGLPDPLRGRVLGMGEDVLSLRPGEGGHGVVQLPTAAIVEALLPAALSSDGAQLTR